MRQLTVYMLFAVLFGLVGYDIYVTAYGDFEATITGVIVALSDRFPLITFALGMLAGHFFWPQQSRMK